ncbi:hypothetical protein I4F81_001897 [Pyropia yezoensis]|uniref:Uncharacterized protein n=1 Tax=Pyropia yezoensis TaxID=2788 RepID=A0ACC3BN24_PYRYE|nr:hypothetical protein I4F81_001897 [Neopyropia yezoensis]
MPAPVDGCPPVDRRSGRGAVASHRHCLYKPAPPPAPLHPPPLPSPKSVAACRAAPSTSSASAVRGVASPPPPSPPASFPARRLCVWSGSHLVVAGIPPLWRRWQRLTPVPATPHPPPPRAPPPSSSSRLLPVPPPSHSFLFFFAWPFLPLPFSLPPSLLISRPFSLPPSRPHPCPHRCALHAAGGARPPPPRGERPPPPSGERPLPVGGHPTPPPWQRVRLPRRPVGAAAHHASLPCRRILCHDGRRPRHGRVAGAPAATLASAVPADVISSVIAGTGTPTITSNAAAAAAAPTAVADELVWLFPSWGLWCWRGGGRHLPARRARRHWGPPRGRRGCRGGGWQRRRDGPVWRWRRPRRGAPRLPGHPRGWQSTPVVGY